MRQDTFANRLQIAMDKKGLKQIDLANKTKIDKTVINKYLSGINEAKPNNLEILAKALGVSETWLLGYDSSNNAEENMHKCKCDIQHGQQRENDKVIINISITIQS